ncbi:MAG: hypothetical protein JXJ04_23700, partial [Spirochaetales bacterium]|nr:hypothetical protein [Spirochaetales bacterium]
GGAFLLSSLDDALGSGGNVNQVPEVGNYSVELPGSSSTTGGLRTWQEAGISAADATRIQNAANRTGQEITVIGSRANGTATVASDWDYILSGNSAQRHSAASSLPKGTGGGELYNPGIDLWQSYNSNAPGYTVLDISKPYVIFRPQ